MVEKKFGAFPRHKCSQHWYISHGSLLKVNESRKSRREELMDPLISIWNLFSKEGHISVKTKVSSSGDYVEYESNGDTYFKALSPS